MEYANEAIRARGTIGGNLFYNVPNYLFREYSFQIREVKLIQPKELQIQSVSPLMRHAQQALINLRKNLFLPPLICDDFGAMSNAWDEVLRSSPICNL